MARLNLYLGPIFILVAAALWGTTGTTQALAPAGATPLTIGTTRIMAGAVVLLLLTSYRKILLPVRLWIQPAFFLAALGMASYQLLFFSGVARTGVAVGTLIAIGSAPVVAGLLGYLVHREKPATNWYIATALALAGCGLLFTSGGDLQANTSGILLAVGAGTAYTVYVMASKGLLAQHHPDAVMAIVSGLGSLFLVPVLVTQPFQWLFTPHGALVTVHLGLVTLAIAYSLFIRGLSMVPAATAVTLTLMEPLTAATLGLTLLQEKPTLSTLAGMALLLTGLVVLSLRRSTGLQPHRCQNRRHS